MRKLFLLLAVFMLFFSCNDTISNNDAKNKLQVLLQIPISDSIEITDYKYSSSINGDYTEAFIVHFKKEEFTDIFNKVKPERVKYINIDKYGYSVQNNREVTSAIFDPKKYIIKYTYNFE